MGARVKRQSRADCRRENLRECTQAENVHNCGMRRNNRSGVKGVHYHKGQKQWRAQIGSNGKRIHLGFFDDINEAAQVRREAELRLHGEFALRKKKGKS